ncbi:MAG: heme ABC exporter ATP-binding protein CcmA [Legionellaceae bacterium]|nr:heme ABC exporter ATP-binding protein CcmA [Legionellaceae bacterium]
MTLEVVNLGFEYSDYELDCSNSKLLNNINFSLSSGSSLHIRGKNGSGKTTMLRLLAGILNPSDGQIYYSKQQIYKTLINYQRNICYVGHKIGISSSLTVLENCYFDLNYHNQDIDELLSKFSLSEYKTTPCSLLSAGMRRRVGLVRLLMTDAKLWLLDEPIIALDTDTIKLFVEHIHAHLEKGGMLVYSSHQQLNLQTKNQYEYQL